MRGNLFKVQHVLSLAFGFAAGLIPGTVALFLVLLTVRRTDLGDALVGIVTLALTLALIPVMIFGNAHAVALLLGVASPFVYFVISDRAFD